jgi:hypothetical protein
MSHCMSMQRAGLPACGRAGQRLTALTCVDSAETALAARLVWQASKQDGARKEAAQ